MALLNTVLATIVDDVLTDEKRAEFTKYLELRMTDEVLTAIVDGKEVTMPKVDMDRASINALIEELATAGMQEKHVKVLRETMYEDDVDGNFNILNDEMALAVVDLLRKGGLQKILADKLKALINAKDGEEQDHRCLEKMLDLFTGAARPNLEKISLALSLANYITRDSLREGDEMPVATPVEEILRDEVPV
jgi:hypothetical protein